jgi:hypothetical protein
VFVDQVLGASAIVGGALVVGGADDKCCSRDHRDLYFLSLLHLLGVPSIVIGYLGETIW